jgi:hypothetical protein
MHIEIILLSLRETVVFGTNFDRQLTPAAPSLCLSPTGGREDPKAERAEKTARRDPEIPSPLAGEGEGEGSSAFFSILCITTADHYCQGEGWGEGE